MRGRELDAACEIEIIRALRAAVERGALSLSVTLPEFGAGKAMLFGYYLQPLHLNADDREDLPRKLLFVLARRKPPVDFLELSRAGVRIPHCFPQGFTIGSVLRITLQEMKTLPLREPV